MKEGFKGEPNPENKEGQLWDAYLEAREKEDSTVEKLATMLGEDEAEELKQAREKTGAALVAYHEYIQNN